MWLALVNTKNLPKAITSSLIASTIYTSPIITCNDHLCNTATQNKLIASTLHYIMWAQLRIIIQKNRAHTIIKGNDLAHTIANDVTTKATISPTPHIAHAFLYRFTKSPSNTNLTIITRIFHSFINIFTNAHAKKFHIHSIKFDLPFNAWKPIETWLFQIIIRFYIGTRWTMQMPIWIRFTRFIGLNLHEYEYGQIYAIYVENGSPMKIYTPSSLNILDNIANHACTNNATTNILICTIYGEPHDELLSSTTPTTQTTHYVTKTTRICGHTCYHHAKMNPW